MTRPLFTLGLAATACAACASPTRSVGKGYARVLETMTHPSTKLDILFVVDDSGSIADDQRALVEAARTELFAQLTTMTGELPDLHVGVVSTTVEVDGSLAPDCDPREVNGSNPQLPNGLLLAGPWQYPEQRCPGIDGNYLSDVSDGAGGRITNFAGTIEDNFACMAIQGSAGCGYEQPLAAMQRALSGEHPENAGFLRDEAMLLVVVLSDEDDSSVADPSIYVYSTPDAYDLNVREFEYGVTCDDDSPVLGPKTGCVPREGTTTTMPISGFVDFLQQLKADPAMVMVAGITPPPGPIELIPGPNDPAQLDLAPVCTPPPGPCADDPTMTCDRDPVLPAVRLDAFLAEFPSRYVLSSICDATMSDRVHRIARTVSGIMTNQACIVGDAPANVDRCRGFDVDGAGQRQSVAVSLVADPVACAYSASQLRAELPAVADGHHVEVECLP